MSKPTLILCLVSAALAGATLTSSRPSAWVMGLSLVLVMVAGLVALYRHANRVIDEDKK